MMKDKKICLIIIVLLISLLVFISFRFLFPSKESQDVDYYKGFEISNNYKEKLCVDQSKCRYLFDVDYPTITYKTKDKNISKIVEAFNNDMKKLYDKTIGSKLRSDSSCGDFVGAYNYQYVSSIMLHLYVDDNYFSVSYGGSDYDLCANLVTPINDKPIIYDRKQKKILSQDEFKKKLNIDDHVIKKSIDHFLEEQNIENLDINYDDISVFYDGNFGLVISICTNMYDYCPVTRVVYD